MHRPIREHHIASTVTSGIRLSLSTPTDTYPGDALVAVTLTIENVSNARIVVQEFRYWHPEIWVETAGGEIVYRSAFPLFVPPSGGPMPLNHMPLLPGEAVERELLIVARAERLRPYVSLVEPPEQVVGDALTLRLIDGTPPRVTTYTDPTVYADIEPPGPVQEALYRIDVSRWEHPGGIAFRASTEWTPAESHRIAPTWDEPDGPRKT